MYETAIEFIAKSWTVTCQMAPYLIGGFLVAGILSVCIPKSWVKRHLGRRGAGPIVTASIVGVPLPLCSCSVIPVVASIRRDGASRAASTSFLLSTPQTGADSIAVTFALMGTTFAVARPIIALATGIIGGLLVYLLVDRRRPVGCSCPADVEHVDADVPCEGDIPEDTGDSWDPDACECGCSEETPEKVETPTDEDSSCCGGTKDEPPLEREVTRMPSCCSSALSTYRVGQSEKADQNLPLSGLWRNAGTIVHYAFVTLPRDIGPALAVGIFVAAAISAIIPPGQLEMLLGQGFWSMLLVIIASSALYICATASVPIAVGLIHAGASPGTALAMLIAGPATNFATLSVIMKILGRRTTVIYLTVMIASAIGAGLLIDHVLHVQPEMLPGGPGHEHGETLGWFDHASGAVLVVMLVASIWAAIGKSIEKRKKKNESNKKG